MLRGDKGASNTDPFACGPTPTNAGVVSPPHIMVLYADLKMLDAYPTDPTTGGPWVMWKGTPSAHLMVPVAAKQVAAMGAGKKWRKASSPAAASRPQGDLLRARAPLRR